jgi:hypothetical protein
MNTGIGNEREVESQGLIVEEKFLSLVYWLDKTKSAYKEISAIPGEKQVVIDEASQVKEEGFILPKTGFCNK